MYILMSTSATNNNAQYLAVEKVWCKCQEKKTGVPVENTDPQKMIFSLHKCVYLQQWCVKWGPQGSINDNLHFQRT